jgi:hypothetical protein
VLFARVGPCVLPLIDFKRATEKLSDYFRSKRCHKESMEAAESFTAMIKSLGLAVDH